MVDGGTPGVVPTSTHTGIGTLLLDASLVAGTFCVEDTFWAAVGCCSDVPWSTRAGFMPIDFPADGVGTTWVWNTWDVWCWWPDDLWVLVAVEERIATVSLGTTADGIVIHHLTLGIGSTCPWARVNTLLLDASLTELALRREKTLWSTVGRSTEVARKAGTHWAGSLGSALTVWSARVRITRVCWLLDHWLS